MKKILLLMMVLAMLPLAAAAEGELSIEAPDSVVRPGTAVVLYYTLPEAGTCNLVLEDAGGDRISVVSLDVYGYAGRNTIFWNGTYEGSPAPEGQWILALYQGESRAEAPVTVGKSAPVLTYAAFASSVVNAGDTAVLRLYATAEGTLSVMTLDGDEREVLTVEYLEAGEAEVSLEAELTGGQHPIFLTLTDEEGLSSEEIRLTLTVVAERTEIPEPEDTETTEAPPGETEIPEETPEEIREEVLPETEAAEAEPAEGKMNQGTVFTPAHTSPYEGQDTSLNYWTLPMDITDEEAVWKVLTAPVTVIDNGKKNAEKTQIVLRSEPDSASEGVGSITCITQGVHVLERGEEWSLIECYSSSFHDSPILNWNALVQGYVPTKYLKEIKPNQEMGLVIDKLTQRLYLFVDGYLYSTLLVSTGLSNTRQPYNETRSGEFLMTSKVGTFSSDNLKCGMAIRFNKGDLIHEVPYILNADGSANYKNCEPKLGTRASHGCIRVQRKTTPEGVNMKWIWNHLKNNSYTKLLIWEDWQGRQIELPPDDMVLYYNPNGGIYYHAGEKCSSAKSSIRFVSFKYGDLDKEPYSKLKWCEYCTPVMRREEIEAINEAHAVGGDHDPVLTEARKTCPRPLD